MNIKFDSSNLAQLPTLVLAEKNGKRIGELPANSIQFKNVLSDRLELRFNVNKADCFDSSNGYNNQLYTPIGLPNGTPLRATTINDKLQEASFKFWQQIKDFKLVWAKEWDTWFQMYVVTEESDEIRKTIQAYSLGEEELSQVMLYNIECNTEDDIARDDYAPTVLFDPINTSASLLHRMSEKIPHYNFGHIDSTVASIQRIFRFDNISIYDAFKEIAQEIDCLFVLNCYTNTNGNLEREINVYDMESYCQDCHSRGNYYGECEECGSTDLLNGYGIDTPIFVTTENLAENISFDIDEGSVKNCYRLVAGDDLMTATVKNCNPDGSSYLWCITKEELRNMSTALANKITAYFRLYKHYQTSEVTQLPDALRNAYNNLVNKYQTASEQEFYLVPTSIIGYPDIMKYYYDTIDLYLYLNNGMMPSVEIVDIDAEEAAENLTHEYLSPVAVTDLSNCSSITADSVVLSVAKNAIDARYDLKINSSTYENHVWTGSFIVTRKTNDEDTYTTSSVSIEITDDPIVLLDQNIDKALYAQKDSSFDIVSLFDLSLTDFEVEIAKYSLSMLMNFRNSCQTCIDIIAQEFVASHYDSDAYMNLYRKYALKLIKIDDEIELRKNEINIILGQYDADGILTTHGVQTFLEAKRNEVWEALDMEQYLGATLWREFCAYRREETFSDSNYISDGLNNADLVDNALRFRNIAQKAINEAAKRHYSISSTLKNLLVIRDFEPIVNYFSVGNRIRINVDGEIYILRLFSYEINYDDLNNLTVTFSDENRVAMPLRNGIMSVNAVSHVSHVLQAIVGTR